MPDKVLITAAVALAVHRLLAGKLMARLALRLGLRTGGKLLAKGLAAKSLAVWLGPLAWFAIGIAVWWDLDEARTKKIKAAQNALRQGYATIESQMLTGEFLDDAAAAAVEGLEQQLQRDREAARTLLDDFFRGLMVQAQSPGYAAFVEGRDEEEGVRALKKVSAAFGTRLAAEVAFGLKYELASRIEAAPAGALIGRHGIGFVELFSRQPETVARLAAHPRHPELFQHVLHANDPDAEMLFFARSLDRFGTLDEAQLEALVLTRLLHPAKRPEDIGKPALTVLGGAADQLDALARHRPEAAARVVDWTLRGMVSGALLKRLSERAERERLFAVMTELGPDTFERAFATAGSPTLLAFVGDFTASWDAGPLAGSQAMALLRADPQGYLRAYAREEGGGKRAVEARHALRQAYGTSLSADTERRLHWLLVHTGFDQRDLTKTAMEDLRTAGIPHGWWPDVHRPARGQADCPDRADLGFRPAAAGDRPVVADAGGDGVPAPRPADAAEGTPAGRRPPSGRHPRRTRCGTCNPKP